MVHIPSLLVGSTVAGVAGLAIHEQMSHRSRLSNKSSLRELTEQKCKEVWNKIQESRGTQDSHKMLPRSTSVSEQWNKYIDYLQDFLGRDGS